MIHDIPEEYVEIIEKMDAKIGEFMQQRANYVNEIIAQIAAFKSGDFVEVYDDNGAMIGEGVILQPVFIKRKGQISYRIRLVDGTLFTNEKYELRHGNPSEQMIPILEKLKRIPQ